MNNLKQIQLIIYILISSLLIAQKDPAVSIPFPSKVILKLLFLHLK